MNSVSVVKVATQVSSAHLAPPVLHKRINIRWVKVQEFTQYTEKEQLRRVRAQYKVAALHTGCVPSAKVSQTSTGRGERLRHFTAPGSGMLKPWWGAQPIQSKTARRRSAPTGRATIDACRSGLQHTAAPRSLSSTSRRSCRSRQN